MNRHEFIAVLAKGLNSVGASDIGDIVSEYEQHFDFKLADGYTEEEIAAKLGDPTDIARQFAAESGPHPGKLRRFFTVIALFFADLFAAPFFIALFAWVLVAAAAALAAGALCVCLVGRLHVALIPYMPTQVAIIMGITALALSVLCAAGTVYCFLYTRQLLRAYARWHKNTLALSAGAPVYPSRSAYPQLGPTARRRLRRMTLAALTLMAVSFIVAYIVGTLSAGAFEFWHVWHWFE